MKEKFQTRASKAEEHVLNMLKSEKNILKPWALLDHEMFSRTLQTTADEVNILFANHANVRPGYEITDNKVYIPNLFVKAHGYDAAFKDFYDLESITNRENLFRYSSIKDFNNIEPIEIDFSTIVNDEGLLQREKLISSDYFKYSFLRRESQEILIEKINKIIKHKEEYFIGSAKEEDTGKIIAYLLNIEDKLIEGFNSFNLQYQPPAVIIKNNGREKITSHQGYVLVLLNLLGFDIIMISPNSTSDIENVVNDSFYNLYYGENNKLASKYKTKNKRAIKAVAALVIAISLLPIGNYAYTKLSKPLNTQANEVITNEITQQKAPSNTVDEDVTSLQNNSVKFTDPFFERMVRHHLNKTFHEEITRAELENVKILFITGSIANPDNYGGWMHVDGKHPMYLDKEGNPVYGDWGDLDSLHDLIYFPNLEHLHIMFQKGLDIAPIVGCKKLKTLNLGFNEIKDITLLSQLPNLEVVHLPGNEFKTIAKAFKNNNNLKELYLELNGQLTDVSELQYIKNLEVLIMDYTPVNNIDFLKNLKKIEKLSISNTRINDISVIQYLTSLKELHLSGTHNEEDSIFDGLDTLIINGVKR